MEKRFDLRIEKRTVGVAKRARRREPDGAAGARSDLAAVLLLPEWPDAAANLRCLAVAQHAKRDAYPEAIETAHADFTALTNNEAPGPRTKAPDPNKTGL